jgi:hypothetical protein
MGSSVSSDAEPPPGAPRRRAAAPQRATAPRPPVLDADPEVSRARTLAYWLDRVPLDAVLGFVIPGGGDVIGSMLGLYIVGIAVRRRLPAIVIARMLLNLAADAVIGIVPLLGDLGDLAFRANHKNVELLTARTTGRRSTWRDWAIVVGAALALIGAVTLSVVATIALFRWIF